MGVCFGVCMRRFYIVTNSALQFSALNRTDLELILLVKERLHYPISVLEQCLASYHRSSAMEFGFSSIDLHVTESLDREKVRQEALPVSSDVRNSEYLCTWCAHTGVTLMSQNPVERERTCK